MRLIWQALWLAAMSAAVVNPAILDYPMPQFTIVATLLFGAAAPGLLMWIRAECPRKG